MSDVKSGYDIRATHIGNSGYSLWDSFVVGGVCYNRSNILAYRYVVPLLSNQNNT